MKQNGVKNHIHQKSILLSYAQKAGFLSVCLWSILINSLIAQDPKIRIGKKEMSIHDMFEISVSITEPIRTYKGFPKISGFVQFRQEKDEQTIVANGKAVRMTNFKVMYRPSGVGTYRVPAFTITINGKSVRHKGFHIKVKKEGNVQDPMLRNFFDEPVQFTELKADVFFDIKTDKKEIYVGEGLNVTMAIYVKYEDMNKIDFPNDLSQQLSNILKKIKPKNCWEENFNITYPIEEVVAINGKKYWQYKVFQASFYPLSAEKIIMPSVPLEVLKVQVAQLSSAFTPIVKHTRKAYHSKAKSVLVKPLPSHPLGNQSAVGHYEMEERIRFSNPQGQKRTTETGKTFAYVLRIQGEGNIANVHPPKPISDSNFEFYSSSVVGDRTERKQNTVYGYRDFRYNIVPKKPGKYDLGDFIKWVYFDTHTQKFDTLRSQIQFKVIGEEVEVYQSDSLQTDLETELRADNRLKDMNGVDYGNVFTNLSLFLLLGTTALVTFRK